MKGITYAEACKDKNLFGEWFSGESWRNWWVLDKAIFGEPLDAAELAIFHELTGRENAPSERATEAWIIAGRRSGKDVKTASLAVYLATIGAELYGWRKRLVRGERGVVQILAVDKNQAQICFNYVRGFLEMPMLAKMVARPTNDTIELNNGLVIEVSPNDQRRVRGRTVVAAVFDEVGHWRSENTVSPDADVYQAVRPAMATMPGAMLIGISSPYARRGLLWQKYQQNFAKDGDVLVVQAPTWLLNLTLSQESKIIADAYENDPDWASAEYGAEFRADLESLVSIEAVKNCIAENVRERMPERQHRYYAFTDPSGGSADSMTLAIAHKEGSTVILDAVREARPPFSPEAVVAEFANVLKTYRISRVQGDRYGGEWVPEQFRKVGIFYEPSEQPKSGLYLDMLPLINSRACDLLDNERLVRQLTMLERRTSRTTGRDIIDHPPGAHDDLANAVAGALVMANEQQDYSVISDRRLQKIEREARARLGRCLV